MTDTTPTTPAAERKRGGRPRLLPEERRTVRVQVGLTQAQAAEISRRADAAGLSDVELIRRLAINADIVTIPAANRDAIVELSRMGNNLNQIARALNSGEVRSAPTGDWFEQVDRELRAIGAKLTGG